MLIWERLIDDTRYIGEPDNEPSDDFLNGKRAAVDGISISAMQNDPNVIVTCAAFRRLQGKAQVYIAPQSDFVRNRLTHTLEVVAIARMLASMIFTELDPQTCKIGDFKDSAFIQAQRSLFGAGLRERADQRRFRKRDLVEAVAAAAMMHDIGNPPFGHIGEYAIGAWFTEMKEKGGHPSLAAALRKSPGDFTNFDGNPQGFRMMSKTLAWGGLGGLRLTYTTLASSIKYPWNSDRAVAFGKPNKYGFFHTESDIFERIFRKLGLSIGNNFVRHPFSFIMEAADDIAYRTSDIEDGFKLNLVPYETAREKLFNIAKYRIEKLFTNNWNLLNHSGIYTDSSRIKYLRKCATDTLIIGCRDAFMNNLRAILSGEMKKDLISRCDFVGDLEHSKDLTDSLSDTAKVYIYNSKVKTVNEQGAYQVIHDLLSTYGSAIEQFKTAMRNTANRAEPNLDRRSQNLISNLHRIYDASDVTDPKSGILRDIPHERIASIMEMNDTDHYRHLVDYVSGMTDAHALRIHSVMTGGSIATAAR